MSVSIDYFGAVHKKTQDGYTYLFLKLTDPLSAGRYFTYVFIEDPSNVGGHETSTLINNSPFYHLVRVKRSRDSKDAVAPIGTLQVTLFDSADGTGDSGTANIPFTIID